MDTLTDYTLFYMNQIQVIEQVAIMPDRKLFYVSCSLSETMLLFIFRYGHWNYMQI